MGPASVARAASLALALLGHAALVQAQASGTAWDDALRASQAVIGKTIGDFTLLDREGRPVRLSSYRGKPLLVSFIYTGCFQVWLILSAMARAIFWTRPATASPGTMSPRLRRYATTK